MAAFLATFKNIKTTGEGVVIALFGAFFVALDFTLAAQAAEKSTSLNANNPYAILFPPQTQAAATTALKAAVAAAGSNLSQTNHVTFLSAESTFSSETPIVNRVSFFATARFDVWLMRQYQSPSHGANVDKWSFVGIVVDKNESPAKAFYLEFQPQKVGSSNLPEPILPRIECYRCHANGPRALRPSTTSISPVVDAREWQLIEKWNAQIAQSGIVKMFEPQGVHLKLPGKVAQEELPFHFCAGCHSEKSGIRSALQWQHAGSIGFLTSHGLGKNGYFEKSSPQRAAAMPIDDRLSEQEMHCLNDWIEGLPLSSTCQKLVRHSQKLNNQRELRAAQKGNSWTLDSAQSWLTAQVSSYVGTFSITGLELKGSLHKEDNNCRAELVVELANATTGVRVRDNHLRGQVLEVSSFPQLDIASDEVRCFTSGEKRVFKLNARVQIEKISRSMPVELKCENAMSRLTCDIVDAAIDLSTFQIPLPQFLGLSVKPRVEVLGQFVFLE